MSQSKFDVIVDNSKCVGCQLCQMRCSLRFTNIFRPSESRIAIELTDSNPRYSIKFLPNCDKCGLCARYCLYGALSLESIKGHLTSEK